MADGYPDAKEVVRNELPKALVTSSDKLLVKFVEKGRFNYSGSNLILCSFYCNYNTS